MDEALDPAPPVAEPAVAAAPVLELVVENPVHRVLQVCGIASNAARLTFINIEGLSDIEAFGAMSGDTDVTEMAKRMASRSSAATGRVILGTMQIKRLQALVYWVKDSANRGLDIDPDMWTPEEMANAMDRKESEYNYGKIDIDLIEPGKCQTDFAWDNWQIAFVNKLSATMGAAKFPIDYVVRPEIDDDYEPMDDDEERRYQIPLAGENFKRDNKLVYTLLKSACIKTDAWTWIQSHDRTSNGRQAWLALVAHYDGTGELNKRVERAKEEISRLHYKDEKVFPFERFVTKLKENFYILSKDKSEALTGKQQVDCLMRGIRSSDTSITSAKINIFQSYRSNFDGAVTFMSGLVANLHASAQLDYANRNSATNKRRYVSTTNSSGQSGGRGRARTGGRYGQRGGRNSGRGRDNRGRGRGEYRKTYANNVDITDPHRNFSAEEWERLGTMRSYVLQLREGGGRSGRNGGRGDNRTGDNSSTNRNSSSVTSANNNNNESNDNATASGNSVVSR
ncbi:hypothetical protein MHU86_15765 [Fragilaria crotonensis]|nr:hypothetical protein MHU86_15765 [Fragilaria crotonensis]